MGKVVVSCSSEAAERFVPRTALRVLLVEPDDSTRHIISALLHNCTYKVLAVPDGLKAWQILKEKHHNVDLVLTEVELLSVSGFALLTLVTEHDACKNIPIIMMSSNDSVTMVLKCMLKGASDFLIKPVRKNELRNLWHHVWRRHAPNGEHIPPNLTAVQQKGEAGINNNTASNQSSDYMISSSKNQDGREEGSEAQSSCTTSFMGAENVYMLNIQGLTQPNCKIISSLSSSDLKKQEESVKLPRESVTRVSETKENSSKFGSDVVGPSNEPCETIASRLGEDHDFAKALTHYERLESESAGNGNITSEGSGSGNRRESDESLCGEIDFIGTFDDRPMCSHVRSGSIDSGSNKYECIPLLELSLRRISASSFKDEKTDENHASGCYNACCAISRYNNSSKTVHSFFPTSTGTCTELDESSDKIHNLVFSHLCENTVGLRYDDACEGYSHVLPSVFYAKPDIQSTWSPKPDSQQERSPIVEANVKQDYERSENKCEEQMVSEEGRHGVSCATGQSCSSSYYTRGAVENLNDEDSVRETKAVRSSEREAALTKFRLKRKDRCYEKKVRYESRKRLAEQRPRVKGQFVRHCQQPYIPADNHNG